MGINGLLPLFKNSGRERSVSDYRGKRVGIDAFSWLHKGALACAAELAQQIATEKYISYVVARAQMLRRFNVEPVLVFDGCKMPLKNETDAQRKQSRRRNREKAMEALRNGQRSLAFECFQKAIDITSQMVCSIMQILRLENIEFYVAPFEADAQLAYFARTGFVFCVITEDSDMVAYNVPQVLYKMDKFGIGYELSTNDLLCPNGEYTLQTFDEEMILTFCILSGCDYVQSLTGIGPKTAYKLVKQHRSIEKILGALHTDPHYTFTPRELTEYEVKFRKAVLAFRHHYVYDPVDKKITSLTPLAKEIPDVIGRLLPAELVEKVCRGEMNPHTLEEYPQDLQPDAKKYRQMKGGGLPAGSTIPSAVPIAAVPLTPLEMAKQKTITSFFSRAKKPRPETFKAPRPLERLQMAVVEMEASSTEPTDPELTPPVTEPSVNLSPELLGAPKRIVRLSRFFAESSIQKKPVTMATISDNPEETGENGSTAFKSSFSTSPREVNIHTQERFSVFFKPSIAALSQPKGMAQSIAVEEPLVIPPKVEVKHSVDNSEVTEPPMKRARLPQPLLQASLECPSPFINPNLERFVLPLNLYPRRREQCELKGTTPSATPSDDSKSSPVQRNSQFDFSAFMCKR